MSIKRKIAATLVSLTISAGAIAMTATPAQAAPVAPQTQTVPFFGWLDSLQSWFVGVFLTPWGGQGGSTPPAPTAAVPTTTTSPTTTSNVTTTSTSWSGSWYPYYW